MEYEYENFTLVDMELVKELWDDGIRDPKDLQKELDFRELSIETIIQIIDTLKHTKKITEMKNIKSFESFSMQKDKCDRCGGSTNGVTIMSMFNEDILCQKCKDDERSRGDYAAASDADNMEIRKGNYNFKGIGYKK